MELVYKILVKEKQPENIGWYDTDCGHIYWDGSNWSTLEYMLDLIHPNWWLDKVKDDGVILIHGDTNPREIEALAHSTKGKKIAILGGGFRGLEKAIPKLEEAPILYQNPYKDYLNDLMIGYEEKKQRDFHSEVYKHISGKKRTLRQEYDLILEKKSELGRAQRDWVIKQFEK